MPKPSYPKIIPAKSIPEIVYLHATESDEADYGLVNSEDTKLLVDNLKEIKDGLAEVISKQIEIIDVLKEIKEVLQGN